MYGSDRTILCVCDIMEFPVLENQFKVLASETRLRIVDVLLQDGIGLRFSEIAKALDIYPSTLEDHLKRLVEVGFISHKDGMYRCNVNTERVYKLAKSLSDNTSHTYFSTHSLTVDDESLRDRFLGLKYDGVYDLLSLMNKAKTIVEGGMTSAIAGGAMDMQLEVSFFEFYQMDLKETDIEVLFTKLILDELRKIENKELFFKGFTPSRTRFYIVDDCNIAMMASESFGALFLPLLEGKVDFTQGLFFSNRTSVKWLHDLFDYLKSQGEELSPKEMRKVWK